MREGPYSLQFDRTVDTCGASTLQLTAVGRQVGWNQRDIAPFRRIRIRGTLVTLRRELLQVARIEVSRQPDRLDVEIEVPNDEHENLVLVDLFFEGLSDLPGREPEILTRLEMRRQWLKVSGPPPAELPPAPILPSHSPLEIFELQKRVQREAQVLADRHVEWNQRVLRELEAEETGPLC